MALTAKLNQINQSVRIILKNAPHYGVYFPFIGWWPAAAFRREDRELIFHVRRAFVMSAFFAAVLLVLGISFIFIGIESRILKLTAVIAVYAVEFLYFALCAAATASMIKKRNFPIPFVDKFADKIDYL